MSKKSNMQALVCIILILGGATMIFGFLKNKCKIQIDEVRKETITYTDENDVQVTLKFKRVGKVVECICMSKITSGSMHTLSETGFKQKLPQWAYPSDGIEKQEFSYSSSITGLLKITVNEEGKISGLYANFDNENDINIVSQFTYIVESEE